MDKANAGWNQFPRLLLVQTGNAGPLVFFLNRNSASQIHADLLAQLPGLGDSAFAKG